MVSATSFSPPVEGILLQQPSTRLFVNDQDVGTATLYVTESCVVWGGGTSSTGSGPSPSLNLLYPSISLHAIQRQPDPVLFMVLNYELRLPELGNMEAGGGDTENDGDFDGEDMPITQLRFMPAEESALSAMYAAMSSGQALHPDPEDVSSDEQNYMDGEDHHDEGEEEFEDAVEAGAAGDEAAARMRSLRIDQVNGHHNDEESMDDAGQFEDD